MRTMNFMPLLAAASIVWTAGCGQAEPEPETETEFFELVHERELTAGDVDPQAVEKLRAANTKSAFLLYRQMRPTDGTNMIFSPFSVSRALASYHDGEREAAAFEALFGFTTETTLEQWARLTLDATDRSDSETPRDKRSTFTSQDIYWIDRVAGGGSAPFEAFDRVHAFDLLADPEGSRVKINDWVEKSSFGMLPDFLAPGVLIDAEAVATNLVFFRGFWPADYEAQEISFAGAEGSSTVPGFKGSGDLRAAVDEDVTVLRLDYSDAYAHWVLMPHDDFEGFATTLDDVTYDELKARTSTRPVDFEVPEFRAESTPPLGQAITELRADTETTGGTLTGAYMEGFLHKAAIEFTREGTKAAAVTAVIEYQNSGSEPEPALEVVIDRPFVHVIEDRRTGSVLFLGEVSAP